MAVTRALHFRSSNLRVLFDQFQVQDLPANPKAVTDGVGVDGVDRADGAYIQMFASGVAANQMRG